MTLKVRHTSQNIGSLVLTLSQGRYNLDPSYQRRDAWKRKRQRQYIGSILNGYSHVPIWLHERDSGLCDVLDGKQRIRAIEGFHNNEFALNGIVIEGSDDDLSGLHYRDLPETYQQLFLDYDLPLNRCEGSLLEAARQFVILQEGEPLTIGEMLWSMIYSDMCLYAQGLSEHLVLQGRAMTKNVRRDSMYAACQIIAIELGYKRTGKPECIEMVAVSGEPSKRIQKEIRQKLDYIQGAVGDEVLPRARTGRVYAYRIVSHILSDFKPKLPATDFGSWYLQLMRDISLNNHLPIGERDGFLTHLGMEMSRQVTNEKSAEVVALLLNDCVKTFDLKPIRHDSKRRFNESERMIIFWRSGGHCQSRDCEIEGGREITFDDFHADHIDPHSNGGPTSLDNAQALCITCNLRKGAKVEA